MTNNKHIMLDLDDPRIAKIAEVISNKTAKKIVGYLADKEASEAEIVRDLKLPANTVNYNVKNLVEAGLIEKTKNFSWSVKGKKVLTYRVAKKSIVISPRNSRIATSVLGALVGVGVLAVGIKQFIGQKSMEFASSSNYLAEGSGEMVADSSRTIAPEIMNKGVEVSGQIPDAWIWFLVGGILALVIFMILNWRRL